MTVNNCQNCNHKVGGELNFYFDKKGLPTVGCHPDKCAYTGKKIKCSNVETCAKHEPKVKDESSILYFYQNDNH